ncbi:hypothetical protein OIU91_14020 [Streptomyces sp. NBC_01456]|uniref:hypothetical protein n=1 Tax=unclassified Streptomyces TaxID=2593676 RepID=UPI002E37FD3C|nr:MULTISPECIES: hypothetical protein [unclassified Streptomyces]
MTERTASASTGDLADPKGEPVPVPGCDVCEPCGQEREVARQAGRSLEVRSLNGVIAGHPHGREVRA